MVESEIFYKVVSTLREEIRKESSHQRREDLEEVLIYCETIYKEYKTNLIFAGDCNVAKTTTINKFMEKLTGIKKILIDKNKENTSHFTIVELSATGKIYTKYEDFSEYSQNKNKSTELREHDSIVQLQIYLEEIESKNKERLIKAKNLQEGDHQKLNVLRLYLPNFPEQIRLIDTPGATSSSVVVDLLDLFNEKTSLNMLFNLISCETKQSYTQEIKKLIDDLTYKHPDTLFYILFTKIDRLFKALDLIEKNINPADDNEFDDEKDRVQALSDCEQLYQDIFTFLNSKFKDDKLRVNGIYMLDKGIQAVYDALINDVLNFVNEFSKEISNKKIQEILYTMLNNISNKYNKDLLITTDILNLKSEIDKIELDFERSVREYFSEVNKLKDYEEYRIKYPDYYSKLEEKFYYNDQYSIKTKKLVRAHYIRDQCDQLNKPFYNMMGKQVIQLTEISFRKILKVIGPENEEKLKQLVKGLTGDEVSDISASQLFSFLGSLVVGIGGQIAFGVARSAVIGATAEILASVWIPVIGWGIAAGLLFIGLTDYIGVWKIKNAFPECIDNLLKGFQKNAGSTIEAIVKGFKEMTKNFISIVNSQKIYDDKFKSLLDKLQTFKFKSLPKLNSFELRIKEEVLERLTFIQDSDINNKSRFKLLDIAIKFFSNLLKQEENTALV